MRIDIRRAKLTDIEPMSVVVDECWNTCFKQIFNPAQFSENTGERRRRKFRKLFENRCDVFVLEADGKISAVCAAQALGEISEVVLIYVLPEIQRQKHGKKLLSHTLREMRKRGCKSAVLEAAENNDVARKFFVRFGFKEQKDDVKLVDGVRFVTYMIDF